MSVAGRARPAPRAVCALLAPGSVLTGSTQGGVCVTRLVATGLALLIGAGCATVEPKLCASDKDCKLNRLCDAGRCVWPGDTTRPSVAVGGLGGPSVPLPQYALEP